MKKPLQTAILFLSFFIIITNSACKKTKANTDVPSVTTQDVMLDVTSTSAQSGGIVSSIGGAAVTANGVVYSTTNQTPTLANTKSVSSTISVTYAYVANLTALTPNTTYYVRAYATNEFGTGYGAVVKFTTNSTTATVTGVVTTVAGNGNPGLADGAGTAAAFNSPSGMAIDAQGNIYISDAFNCVIRKMTPNGTVTTIAGTGTAGYTNGPASSAQFYSPAGLTLDPSGNIYVADYGNNVIRKITPSGTVSTYAGTGYAGFVDGVDTIGAAFNGPAGVVLDSKGNMFVADANNNMIRKIATNGSVTLFAGTRTPGYVNATVDSVTGVWGSFDHPCAITIGTDGNFYIADRGNSAIREITPAGVLTTIAGGPAQTTLVGLPAGLVTDAQGDLFITDESGQVIELTSARLLYDLAGAQNVAGFADGTGTAAQFNAPQGIVMDSQGNLYVADSNNNRIRKLVVTSVTVSN